MPTAFKLPFMDKFNPALPVPEGVPNGQVGAVKVSGRTRGLTSRELRRVRRFIRINKAALTAALQPFKGCAIGDSLREDVCAALSGAEAAVLDRYGHLLPYVSPITLPAWRVGRWVAIEAPDAILQDREPTILRA